MQHFDVNKNQPIWGWSVQHPWHPGCGWLDSCYPNRTWDRAWEEAKQYADFAARNGVVVAVRVTARGEEK